VSPYYSLLTTHYSLLLLTSHYSAGVQECSGVVHSMSIEAIHHRELWTCAFAHVTISRATAMRSLLTAHDSILTTHYSLLTTYYTG
jgi:hypothetical protein